MRGNYIMELFNIYINGEFIDRLDIDEAQLRVEGIKERDPTADVQVVEVCTTYA